MHKILQYPTKNIVEYIIWLIIKLSYLISIVFIFYAIFQVKIKVWLLPTSVVAFLFLIVLDRVYHYYLVLNNSDTESLMKFSEMLNFNVSNSVAYMGAHKGFDVRRTISRLQKDKYKMVKSNIFEKDYSYDKFSKLLLNEPSINKYTICFHINESINGKPDVLNYSFQNETNTVYSVLITSNIDYLHNENICINKYSAIIVYEGSNILQREFDYLKAPPSHSGLDIVSKKVFEEKEFCGDIFFNRETLRIVRIINKLV